MTRSDGVWSTWTRGAVEERLVRAFRALPEVGLSRRGSALRLANGSASPVTMVLGWLDLVADDLDRAYLAAWARSQATGISFAAFCAERDWKRSSAEDGRRRAAAAIADAMAAGLDHLAAEPDLPPMTPAMRAATERLLTAVKLAHD